MRLMINHDTFDFLLSEVLSATVGRKRYGVFRRTPQYACAAALNMPLQTLLDTTYASCGVTVSWGCCC